MQSVRARSYCFTINNYSDDEQKNLRALAASANVKYLIFGREQGDSGTPHLQGYVQFTGAQGAGTAKRRIGARSHVEVARGRPEQNIEYCSKDGDFEEFGERPRPGRRSDLLAVRDAIQEGKSLRRAIDEGVVSGYQALRHFAQLERVYQNKPRQRPELHLIFGESGSGKSYWAKQQLLLAQGEDEDVPWAEPAEAPSWWEGVDTCKRVLLDDLRVESRKHFTLLLRMFDDYNIVQCPIKGGFIRWTAETVYITCPNVASLVPQGESTWQLVRRCTRIMEATIVGGNHVVKDVKDEIVDMFKP